MAVEERFGIEMSDAEAVRCVTPKILIETILSKVPVTDASICMSRRAFHVIRKTFIQKFGCQRSAITPSTPLETLLPREGRRRVWSDLQSSFAANLPPLTRPLAVKQGLGLLFVSIFSGVLLISGFTLGMLPLAAIVGGLGWAIGFKITESSVIEFPKACKTVGELAQHLAIYSDAVFKPQGRKWTRAEVAEGVKQITMDYLGLSPSDYREDAEFVKDFGAG